MFCFCRIGRPTYTYKSSSKNELSGDSSNDTISTSRINWFIDKKLGKKELILKMHQINSISLIFARIVTLLIIFGHFCIFKLFFVILCKAFFIEIVNSFKNTELLIIKAAFALIIWIISVIYIKASEKMRFYFNYVLFPILLLNILIHIIFISINNSN